MDTSNQTSTSLDTLQQWWDTKNFEGKHFCQLSSEGNLSILPFPEKAIAHLNHITGDAVIQNLIEKFKDLSKQYAELHHEWITSNDKIKLMSKVQRLNDHIKQTNAIGDLESILQPLKSYEAEIQVIIEQNYTAKQQLVAKAEGLSIENNNWKEITQHFKTLSEEWKNLGFVDKKRNEALWERLENVKTKFFEEKREHQEDIEKEMLSNLDLKMELVEKAEAQANSENWKETTEFYKQLLEDWKKTGRTLPEKNESLWQQFIAAKNHFFDRKKMHTDAIKIEQEANYEKKKAIVEKAEILKNSTDWAITSKAFTALMDEWKSIGPVPSEHNNALWAAFSTAKEVFFEAKRVQANAYKSMLEENLKKKTALIERAENVKNSSNWRETTEEMNQLFEDWKQIGFVGKEHSEPLWEQFISARKHFFNRKDQDRTRRKQQYEKNKELHLVQSKNFLNTLILESEDEEKQIIEFKENLEHITEGPKSEELKAHLNNLITEIEGRLKQRALKIEELQSQIADQSGAAEITIDSSIDPEGTSA